MTYPYEDQLLTALQERENLLEAINGFNKKKELLNSQIKEWMKINNLTRHSVEDKQLNVTRDISLVKTKRRSITDYEVLIRRLGDEADVYISEKESETLKVGKHK